MVAERVEAEIGRELEYVSGGATTSLSLEVLWANTDKINMLRLADL